MRYPGLTISALKAKFPPQKSHFDIENPWGHFVLRPTSYYPAWLFLRLGVSANKVTGLAILTGVGGAALMALGWGWSLVAGAACINLRAWLDYVDGDIARYSETTSPLGGYLDTMQHYTAMALVPLGMGLGMFRHPDGALDYLTGSFLGLSVPASTYLAMGVGASMLIMFTYLASDRLALAFSLKKPREFFRPRDDAAEGVWRLVFRVGIGLLNVNGPMMVLLFFATVFHFTTLFLIFWVFLSVAGFGSILGRIALRSGKLLNE